MTQREAEPTIKFAIGVFRHGIRAPLLFPMPNDPYKDYDKYFPEGAYELTKAGKKLMAEIGKRFRLRYDKLLGEMYSPNVVHFRSTATSRSMMSTEVLAQTIYPPKDYQKWDDKQNWHPIPVWGNYGEIDKIECIGCNKISARYSELRQKALNSIKDPEIENLYATLSKSTGRIMKCAEDLSSLFDVLNFQHLNGLKLPNWTEKVYPEPLHRITKKVLKAWVADNPEMLLLTSGPLLHFIKSQLSDKANKKLDPDRKVVLFGGHDTSLTGLLAGIKNEEPLSPSPGAMLVFELHEIQGKHIVKAFYLDVVKKDEDFHEISIPITTTKPSTLDDFLTSVKSYNDDEWKRMLF